MSGLHGWGGGYRRQRRLRRTIVGFAIAGGVSLLFVFAPNKNKAPEHFSAIPATPVPAPVKAKFSREERYVAARFIQTAVAGKNLEEAWTLVGPNLRGNLTREQWITGDNPVLPFPFEKFDTAPYTIAYSYTDTALLEVSLLPKKTGAGSRPAQLFQLVLKKVGHGNAAHWVVDNWVRRQ